MKLPLFETPILFCIFNRPSLTEQVFERIAQIRPKTFLIIADGPRPDRLGEEERVSETRAVLDKIDWDCDFRTSFSDTNLGCGRRMATGIDWAFNQCEELIILEDDCLPCQSFFPYCEQLLERYRYDERISMISGDNFQPNPRSESSYYFSNWPHIWGWASWRRAWKGYDLEVKNWPKFRESGLLMDVLESENQTDHWTDTLDRCLRGEIDTWDFAWTLHVWQQSGLTILPERNLIKNLGFGDGATHTTDRDSPLSMLKTYRLDELIHPKSVKRCIPADDWTFENIFQAPQPHSNSTAQQTRKRAWLKRFFQFQKSRSA